MSTSELPAAAPEPGIAGAPRPRDAALDALRMIAVLLMIASHTTRLIAWDERRGWSVFSLLIEPLTASLFLILVGASLAHSWRSARASIGRAAWYRKQALRAAALWAVSCLFYTLEDGFHLPDALTMSGILATIAYAGLMGMLLVSAPRPIPLLLAVSAVLLALHCGLDARGLRIFAVNGGNSPLLPLFPFACLGALGALSLESGGRGTRAGLVTAALLTLAFLLHRHSFADIFSKPLGRFETVRTLAFGKDGARVEKIVPYYNLRPILVPMIASLVVLAYALLALIRPWLDRGARWLLPMGRRSLDVYILHLSLLAILVVSGGKRPLGKTWQGDAAVLSVIAVCYAWTAARDRFPLRRRADGRSGRGPGPDNRRPG
ncbi:MAG TPA: acyltransferase family protein [Fibrobacteria bacterium]|nr:acyltransferase family protein [Fibrobacteria bacterium]